MKIAFWTGLGAGVLCACLHFSALTGSTSAGSFLYYAPLFIFFAAIYFSIKRNSTVNHNGQIGFKDALKYGGITALLIAFLIGVGFYIALTHTDVRKDLEYMVSQNMSSKEMQEALGNITRENMGERAKFFAMPYFLLGFMMTVGAAFVVRLMQSKKTNP